ncbi:MAG: transporter [Dyella sp.]|nr:transporter [Dyella sp.]
MSARVVRTFQFAAFAGLWLHIVVASAQELEPRTYSSSPIGTNFIGASYSYLTGDVLTDPSLPVTNVEAHISTLALAYVHTFALAGHSSSFGVVLPTVSGNLTGDVIDAPTEIHRGGMGDARLRFAFNLIGNPAMTPEEFARTPQTTSLGISLTMSAPTGVYDSARLVNIGTNRWSFKPEIGLSHPWGNWFIEASAGAWFFTTNHDFYGGKERSQDPIYTAQLYGGYTFRPGMWLAGAVGYASGGQTTVNGVTDHNRQSNARYGLTFSAPFARGWSAKVAVSNGLVTRIGGDYKSISLAVQYRWFDK